MTDWCCVHAFYNGSLDRLLVDAVRPLLRRLQREERIRRFFFIRHWNGGMHVRLRVEPGEGVEREGLRDALREELEAWMGAHPGGPGNPDAYAKQAAQMDELRASFTGDWEIGQAHLEGAEPFLGGDLVQPRTYTYDAPRYGGEHARELTEAHFCSSSRLVLELLARGVAGAGPRNAWCLRLMAVLAPALELDATAAAELFWRYFDVSSYMFGMSREGFVERFGFTPFEQRREEVVEVIRQVQADEPDGDAVHPVVRSWGAHLRECVAGLDALESEGRLTVALEDPAMDYLHMLNNRFGVPVGDELYMAYLLARGHECLVVTA